MFQDACDVMSRQFPHSRNRCVSLQIEDSSWNDITYDKQAPSLCQRPVISHTGALVEPHYWTNCCARAAANLSKLAFHLRYKCSFPSALKLLPALPSVMQVLFILSPVTILLHMHGAPLVTNLSYGRAWSCLRVQRGRCSAVHLRDHLKTSKTETLELLQVR